MWVCVVDYVWVCVCLGVLVWEFVRFCIRVRFFLCIVCLCMCVFVCGCVFVCF